MGASAAESVLSFFGFTRVNAENQPLAVVNRSVSNVARFDGPDSGDMAALSIGNSISIDPTLVGAPAEDQLAFESLCQRWTLVKAIPWAIGATGDLATVYVSPFFCRIRGDVLEPNLTTAGYCALPFSFWRMDMEYELIIPASKTHRGRIQVLWTPALTSPPTDPTNVSVNTIIDVSNNEMVRVRVGYARETPFLECRLIPEVPGYIVQLGSTNGTLHFRVVNPLTAQSDEANTEIFVFARASNVQMAAPRDQISYMDAALAPTNFHMANGIQILQAGDDFIDLVPATGAFPSDDLYFGEIVASARALMQKPSLLAVLPTSNLGTYYPKMGSIPYGLYTNVTKWEWCIHYAAMFLGVAASERFKIFPESDGWAGAAPTSQDSNAMSNIVHTLAPVTFCGANRGAEFTVPFYRPIKWISVIRDATQSRGGVGSGNHVQCWAPSTAELPFLYNTYHSYGADIRVARFRQAPRFRFVTGKPPQPWWE